MKRLIPFFLLGVLLLSGFRWPALRSPLPAVSVTTVSVSEITTSSAVCKFTVNDPGNLPKTLGVCIGKGPTPTITGTKFGLSKSTQGPTTFYSQMTGLTPATILYVRAFATLATGTVYGNALQFKTLAPAKPQ